MTFFQTIETELGLVQVNVGTVIGKIINGVDLVGSELDAFLKWVVSHTADIQTALNNAAPIIASVGALATTAATGNPAAGAIVAEAITGVDKAMNIAETAVKAMDKAKTSLTETGGGTLVNDTAAVTAAIHTITGANSSVAAVSTAALAAAQTIQAIIPAATPAPAPAAS